MPILTPPPNSPKSDLEQRVHNEDQNPRYIPESEGNNKRTLIIGISAIVVVLLALVALFYGIFVGF